MALKDILVHLASYPEPVPTGVIEQAVGFSAAMGAPLSGLAVQVDFPLRSNVVADYLIGLSAIAAEEEQKSLDACRAALDAFAAAARGAGVLGAALLAKADYAGVGDRVAEYARTRDLCLVPLGDNANGQRPVAQAVIFDSGRPVLLFRPGVADLAREGPGCAVVAWDGSRSAARALSDAIPILQKARDVQVLTVTNEKPGARGGMGKGPVRHLRAHGVPATDHEVDADGRRIGAVLQAYAASRGADLLVMGAYGHSRLQEFILGGATEHMLHDPKIPLLLSH